MRKRLYQIPLVCRSPLYPEYAKKILLCLLFAGLLFLSADLHAQQSDSLRIGQVKGKVKDSLYNFMLLSATVAVYRDADSSLLQFTLPNSLGEFTVPSLPLALPLRIVVTHVGYKPLIKHFVIDDDRKVVDLGLLHLHQNNDEQGTLMEEVVVQAKVPVRMNGDTLEFNADAFRIDSNATAEELMRRLPGFSIWGDGDITFNGKKINAVMVEGKPFMGSSDLRIATQNLPKSAIDKIQVYQQRDEKNPLDSTLFANIKLKDNKKMGYFGKLGGGYGTDKRYSGDAMLSAFNKKLQVSTVGAFNNINKLAGSTEVLLRNSPFRSEGTDIEYQSDFTMRGENKPAAAGVSFQYDLIENPVYLKSSRVNGNYFLSRNDVLANNNIFTSQFLNADTVLSQRSVSSSRQRTIQQNFYGRHIKENEKIKLVVDASLNHSYENAMGEKDALQEKSGIGIISSSQSLDQKESDQKSIKMGIEFTNREDMFSKKRVPRVYTLGYRFRANNTDGNASNQIQFQSLVNPLDNRIFDRLYEQQDVYGSGHSMTLNYPGLKQLIFNQRRIGGINIGMSGSMSIDETVRRDKVFDKNTLSGKYELNDYLTNQGEARTEDIIPSLDLSKFFNKGLSNRYHKSVWIDIHLRNQFYGMNHTALQTIQNFAYWYSTFIPAGQVTYNNHQYGSYEVKYKLNYSTAVTYPGVNNIAPLIDSANLWYRPVGNPRLRPQYKKDFYFTYDFSTRTSKNPFTVSVNAGIGQIDNNIADSALYDEAGVRTVYYVNIDGNRYANSGTSLKKYLQIKKSTFEISVLYNVSLARNPQYINSLLNIIKSRFQQVSLDLTFKHKDLLTLKLEEGWMGYTTRQTGVNNNRFISSNRYTRFIGALQLPGNMLWSSNLTYNRNSGNRADPIYFTIWNANLSYRFMKGEKGEVKFSAMDLLRENKGIVNTSNNNEQILTSSNVLQSYYMLTLSYYPRKFGK